MIADKIIDKNLNPVVTELFIRGRKLSISIIFITKSYFKIPKEIRLNSTHFLLWKFQIRELQQIALKHTDIDFKDEIPKMSREVNFNNLTCFKGPNFAPITFISFRGPLNIYEEIKNVNISIKKAEEDQNKFKWNLSEITSGNPMYRKNISQIQKKY